MSFVIAVAAGVNGRNRSLTVLVLAATRRGVGGEGGETHRGANLSIEIVGRVAYVSIGHFEVVAGN
jgi:hypothetical protein